MVVREWIFFLRHEDFNRSMFDLVQLLLERSGLGYSYYVFNQNNGKILERDLLSPDGRFEHFAELTVVFLFL